ncbi:MAG: hypothetical protein SW127_15165 [Actinomycetota bacterium]|nr:hypothetical protein [Actinomycetota bacterium]
MNTPSWDELVERNAAAARLSLSGHLSVVVREQEIAFEERFTFWHCQGRWRVESDGQTVYVDGPGDVPLIYFDGKMRRQYPLHFIMWFAESFDPRDLLGESSLLDEWRTGVRVIRPTSAVTVGGRPAWSVKFSPVDHDIEFEVVLDAETGVLVRHVDDDEIVFEVTDLVVHERIPDERFTWGGPIAADDEDDFDESEEQVHTEILDACEAAVARKDEVRRIIETVPDRDQVAALMRLLGATQTGALLVLEYGIDQLSPEWVDGLRVALARERMRE